MPPEKLAYVLFSRLLARDLISLALVNDSFSPRRLANIVTLEGSLRELSVIAIKNAFIDSRHVKLSGSLIFNIGRIYIRIRIDQFGAGIDFVAAQQSRSIEYPANNCVRVKRVAANSFGVNRDKASSA